MKYLWITAACWLTIAVGGARAAVVYSNPIDTVADVGNCSFNTACGTEAFGSGDDFGAQLFTLAASTTLLGGSFTDFDGTGPVPTSANWMILQANGSSGLPGTLVASGSSAIVLTAYLGTDGTYDWNQHEFDIGPVALDPGSYYFAVQAVTTNIANYLSQGIAGGGAAETDDGGATWNFSYASMPSIAVALFDAPVTPAPEPATMTLLGTGLLGLGWLRRRR